MLVFSLVNSGRERREESRWKRRFGKKDWRSREASIPAVKESVSQSEKIPLFILNSSVFCTVFCTVFWKLFRKNEVSSSWAWGEEGENASRDFSRNKIFGSSSHYGSSCEKWAWSEWSGKKESLLSPNRKHIFPYARFSKGTECTTISRSTFTVTCIQECTGSTT